MKFLRDDSGLETAEWAIVAGLVIVGLTAIVMLIAVAVRQRFRKLGGALGW